MSYTIAGTPISSIPTNLTTTGVTTLFTATKRTTILSLALVNYDGGATNITIDLNDGTTSHYLYNTFSINAHTREVYNEPFVLNSGWTLTATASAANRMMVLLTYAEPDAMVQRTGYEAFTK